MISENAEAFDFACWMEKQQHLLTISERFQNSIQLHYNVYNCCITSNSLKVGHSCCVSQTDGNGRNSQCR